MTGARLDVVIRRAREADLDEVMAIERDAFSDPWSRGSFRHLFDHLFGHFTVAEELGTGRVLGYVVAWFVVEDGEIANLAVAPSARRRGIGARLLEDVLASAAARGCHDVYLEVRESNRHARVLYETHGFEVVRRRVRYYQRPTEDALVMRRTLSLSQPAPAAKK
jgi:ribosomal-protein-alanine N-acetyltransferase